MLYELRTYHVVPGKLPAVNDRFERHTLPLFAKHGINPVGFWTTYIGPSANTLTYILAWDSLGDRETIWNGFASDPDLAGAGRNRARRRPDRTRRGTRP